MQALPLKALAAVAEASGELMAGHVVGEYVTQIG